MKRLWGLIVATALANGLMAQSQEPHTPVPCAPTASLTLEGEQIHACTCHRLGVWDGEACVPNQETMECKAYCKPDLCGCQVHCDAPAQEPESEPPPITLSIFPRQALAPPGQDTYVRVRWRIARHADNRRCTLTWESETRYGHSEYDLDGDRARVTEERMIALSAGVYKFRACVIRVRQREFCDGASVEIL